MPEDNQRNDVYFFIIEEPTSIDHLLSRLYLFPTADTRKHFLHVNSHLDPINIRPGQLVVVTPADPKQCTQVENEFAEMARHIETLNNPKEIPDAQTSKIINNYYELLTTIDEQTAGAVGAFSTAYGYRVADVAKILKEIEDLYVRTFNKHGRFGVDEFYKQRQILFRRLDESLGSVIRARAMSRQSPRIKTALGLSTKSLLNTWTKQGSANTIPKFEQHYQRIGGVARNLRWLGYAGIGLDGYYSYRQIHAACSEGNNNRLCTKRKFTEGGRLTGSVAGGAVGGGVAAYGVCNLIFGFPSGGTSLLWCGILAGGGGAIAGGNIGGSAGEEIGEFIFENKY